MINLPVKCFNKLLHARQIEGNHVHHDIWSQGYDLCPNLALGFLSGTIQDHTFYFLPSGVGTIGD